MSSAKHIEAVAVLAKVESNYKTDATPVTTADGVQIIKPRPEPVIAYSYDGARTAQNGGYGTLQRAVPGGRIISGSIKCEGKGNGANYASAAVTVPHIHALLRMAGFDATLNSTTSWSFAPTAATSTPASGSLYFYGQGELWKGIGAYCNLKWTAEGDGIPVWEFPFQAVMETDPADAALPTVTYHSQTVIPPVATGIAFTMGSFTSNAVVRKIDFDFGRSIDTARVNLVSSNGHAGFAPGQRNPSVTLLLEATALQTTPFTAAAGLDPYSLYKTAQTFALSWTVGSTQYNRYTFNLGSLCQLSAPPKLITEGPVALWELVVEPSVTSQIATDDVTISFT